MTDIVTENKLVYFSFDDTGRIYELANTFDVREKHHIVSKVYTSNPLWKKVQLLFEQEAELCKITIEEDKRYDTPREGKQGVIDMLSILHQKDQCQARYLALTVSLLRDEIEKLNEKQGNKLKRLQARVRKLEEQARPR